MFPMPMEIYSKDGVEIRLHAVTDPEELMNALKRCFQTRQTDKISRDLSESNEMILEIECSMHTEPEKVYIHVFHLCAKKASALYIVEVATEHVEVGYEFWWDLKRVLIGRADRERTV
jgi:hypothetical protein